MEGGGRPARTAGEQRAGRTGQGWAEGSPASLSSGQGAGLGGGRFSERSAPGAACGRRWPPRGR